MLTYIFLIIIFSFPIFHIALKDKDFSFIENRPLKTFPKFSYENLISGEFNNDISSYIDDHFPLRDDFISIRSLFEILIGRRDINGVYISKNNYLIEVFKDIDIDITKKNISLINNLSDDYNITLMLIPTSSEVLSHLLPSYALRVDEKKYLNYVKTLLNPNVKFINPLEPLFDRKDDYIYYKTDHHYTTLGAYICYLKYLKENGLDSPLNMTPKKVTDDFLGSLFSKVNLKGHESDSIYIYESKNKNPLVVNYMNKKTNSLYEFSHLKNKRDGYNIFLDNNHPLIKITTSINNNKSICILKDSFCNSFIPFLVDHFNEIHVIDLRFFQKNIISYLVENNLKDILVYYNTKNFSLDKNLIFIERK